MCTGDDIVPDWGAILQQRLIDSLEMLIYCIVQEDVNVYLLYTVIRQIQTLLKK